MLIFRLINIFLGYVIFIANGGFPERFVNLCSRMSVKAWDLRPSRGTIIGKCRASDYKKLRTAAKKSGMKLRIKRKRGLPFFFKAHKTRLGFFAGIPLFVIFIMIMSGRIWSVNFTGNVSLSEDVLRNALKECGVCEGVRTDSFDVASIELRLPSKVEGLSWIALNVDGSVLHVEVRENIEYLEPSDYSHPCHIVASKDGFLKVLETHEGTKIAKINSAVTKGQILISGIIEAKDKSIRLCHAKGYAAAETTDKMALAIKKSQTVLSVCDYDFRLKLDVFNIPLPLGVLPNEENSCIFTKEYRMHANGKRLPVSCTVSKRTSFEKEEKVFSDNEAKLLLVSKLHEKLIEKSLSCEILDCKTVFSDDGEAVKSRQICFCLKISVRKQIS